MTTLMWEVRAAPGRRDDLVAHVLATTGPAAQVYRSSDDRVVVIDPSGEGPAEPAADLIDRSPHRWRFEPVARQA